MFATKEPAGMKVATLIELIIGLSLALLVLAYIGPTALNSLANANITDPTQLALFGLVGVFFIIAVVYAVYKSAIKV
jgi:hypothetical protein